MRGRQGCHGCMCFFFFQAEDGIRDLTVTGVQTCALPIYFIWETAARLGYKNTFVDQDYAVGGDDHFSFIRRGVAGCDLIDFSIPYWHTTEIGRASCRERG